MAQYEAELSARQHAQEVSDLAEELVETETGAVSGESQPGQGFGIGFDLSKAKEGLGLGGPGAELGLGVENLMGEDSSQVKRTRELRQRWRELEEEYGAGIVVVLGDLAVCPNRSVFPSSLTVYHRTGLA